MNILDMIRTMDKAEWKQIWQLQRRLGYADRSNDPLVKRQEMAEDIYKHAVNGKIAVNVDQMDCDCSRWTSSNIMPAVPVVIERHLEAIYDSAEGPIYGVWFSSPEDKAEYVSRDLALEAYEDGHPGSVSMARFDEDGDYAGAYDACVCHDNY